MTGTRIRSFFTNHLRRLGGFSCTDGGKNSFVPFELPKRLYIPNNNELRKAVTNTLETHKHKKQWLKHYFQGKTKKYKKFIKDHSQPGAFTDN